MNHIALVSGTKHIKIANSLHKSLTTLGFTVDVITAKSNRDEIINAIRNANHAVWLANPQTTQNNYYTKILAVVRKRGLPIIPVGINGFTSPEFPNLTIQLRQDTDWTAQQISEAVNPALTPMPASKIPYTAIAIGALIFAIGFVAVLLLSMSNQPEELLPTLVALQLDDSTRNQPEANAQLTGTPTNASGNHIASGTSESAEATEQVETTEEAESTEEFADAESTEEFNAFAPTETSGILAADFAADIPRGDAPLSVNISNLSSGVIDTYRWDYETDGVVDSTEFEPPTIIYSTPGVYTLTLTVRGVNGNIVESEQIIEVYDASRTNRTGESNGSVNASFSASTTSGKYPLNVQFVNRSLGSNLTYQWDFDGDSKVDYVGISPSPYTYRQAGSFNASLTAVSEQGRRDTSQIRINVYQTDPDEATEAIYETDSNANFTVSKASGTVPFVVDINNLSLGTNNRYEWDFNSDGVPDSASAKPPQQRYATPGTYTIALTVYGFDRFGAPKISRAQTQVTALPVKTTTDDEVIIDEDDDFFGVEADFVSEVVEGTAPLLVNFYNYSIGDSVDYQWDFNGDGVTDSTEFEPSYTYTKQGTYEVVLRVSGGGETDQTSLTIQVFASAASATPLPSATLTKTPTGVVSGSTTPTRTPSPTPLPSATPTGGVVSVASNTPLPTASGNATNTPLPTLTHTPVPSSTPLPTLTHTPIPTNTPLPTATHTPIPSNTPIPTATPEPVEPAESGE